MEDLEKLRAQFFRTYANLPEPEKFQVVAIVDEKTYSWDKAYVEISRDTKLGIKILKKMKYVEIL